MSDALAIHELDFEASATLDGVAELRLSGSADTTIVPKLSSLVEALHGKLVAASHHHVVVNIRSLEFMNASCFNVFVTWIGLVHELEPGRRYQLRFQTNTAIPWQRRSLHTLSCFATDLVVVEA